MLSKCFREFFQEVLEAGRSYSLELRSNATGRFLLCSACSIESKRFILVFPEGKGFLGDWNMLAQKLGSLEVASSSSPMLTGNMMALKEEISCADAVGGRWTSSSGSW